MIHPRWIALLLGSVIIGLLVDWRATTMQSREIATMEARLATRRRIVAAAARRLAEQRAAERAAEEQWDVVAAQISIDQRYGPAPAKIWRSRIESLQEAMARTPGMQVPELAHLQLKDWVEGAVRATELPTADLGRVLAALRYRARSRVAERIQDALERYLVASGDAWPTDLRELQPLLPANVTEEMLAHYRLPPTSTPETQADRVIAGDFGDILIAIKPDSLTAKGKPETAWTEDTYAIFDGLGSARMQASARTGQELLIGSFRQVIPVLVEKVSDKQFEDLGLQVKAAVRQYMTTNGGRAPRSVADIQPLLPASSAVAQELKQVMAQLEYAIEHGGAAPTDPQKLKRYIDALDDAAVLRRMRLTQEADGHVTMDFKFGF